MPTIVQVTQALYSLTPNPFYAFRTARNNREAYSAFNVINDANFFIWCSFTHFADYLVKRKYLMAKQVKKTSGDFNFDFVNVRLSAKELETAKEWIAKHYEEVEPFWIEILREDYKITSTFSPKQELFYVTVVGGAEHHMNNSRSLTSHAQDPVTALLMSYYKVAQVFSWEKWVATEREDLELG